MLVSKSAPSLTMLIQRYKHALRTVKWAFMVIRRSRVASLARSNASHARATLFAPHASLDFIFINLFAWFLARHTQSSTSPINYRGSATMHAPCLTSASPPLESANLLALH